MIKHILIIDDDADDKEIFCEALQILAPDYSCSGASDVKKAFEGLDKNEILPDLIFLDINMPRINGWQCLVLLKKHPRYEHIPVILYSTSCDKEIFQKAVETGALCFYCKPNRFSQLVNNMKEIVFHLNNGSLGELPQTGVFHNG